MGNYNVFYMSLLEHTTTRKEWEDETNSQLKFEADDKGKKYEVERIWDNAVYAKKLGSHLPGFYYLVLWKVYPEEENTWEPALAMQYFRKLISTFHKNYPKKPTATSLLVNTALPIARATIRPEANAIQQKRSQSAETKGAKYAKKSWEFEFLSRFWLCLLQRQKNFFVT